MTKKIKPVAKATKAVAKPELKVVKAAVKTEAKVVKPSVTKPVSKPEVKAVPKIAVKPAVKVAPKAAVKPVVKPAAPTPKELIKEKVSELVKKDAVEKAKVTKTAVVKPVSNTISFEEIKKSLTRPFVVNNKFL